MAVGIYHSKFLFLSIQGWVSHCGTVRLVLFGQGCTEVSPLNPRQLVQVDHRRTFPNRDEGEPKPKEMGVVVMIA